jgi:Adenylate and Guanylate cyclase catalytic domain
LTVLFCDLVGSTAIADRLDPEEWCEIVADYHHVAAEAISGFGGHVAQYLGDDMMAYFGQPEAHDNDAEGAARAGLAMLDAISTFNQRPARPELSARVGIDSGTVVVGSSAAGRPTSSATCPISRRGCRAWALEVVPPFMKTLAHLSPASWAMDAYLGLIFDHATATEVVPDAAIVFAFAVVIALAGIVRLRPQLSR